MSGSFWDGGQRPELRAGQYCTGDTRLIMDPFNPSSNPRVQPRLLPAPRTTQRTHDRSTHTAPWSWRDAHP
eukprot:4222231-Prymnesium_polylepis.1